MKYRVLSAQFAVSGLFFAWLGLMTPVAVAQGDQGYGLKVYRTDSSLYPFVQVYLRTFDLERKPLVNLNELNLGIMVNGRPYDVSKRQYFIQTVARRPDVVRAIFVLDTSGSMRGAPFEAALKAAAAFIDAKREQDEVAVIALDESDRGHELISDFERDSGALVRRLAGLRAETAQSRIYDALAAAMQLAATTDFTARGDSLARVASTSIVLFSDGADEGSALSRSDLMNRISGFSIPVPVTSMGYVTSDPSALRNLEALSTNSFGGFHDVSTDPSRMIRIVEDIHRVMLNDYVLTFRSYVPVDGGVHNLRIGLEYPSGSGQRTAEAATFEAISPPPLPAINQARQQLNQRLEKVDDPYMEDELAVD